MAKAFPLQTLLDHARHRMQAGERLLLMIRHKEEQAKLKLVQLQSYRAEYQDRLSGRSQNGIDIHLMRDFHVFMVKLERAVEHQTREVEAQHAHWLEAHRNWLELRQKVKSYEVLERRHHEAERQQQDRREQRQSDEQSGRKAAARILAERH
jgi:flagellar FliJ protein